MTKRKKANSAASHSMEDGHLLGPPRGTPQPSLDPLPQVGSPPSADLTASVDLAPSADPTPSADLVPPVGLPPTLDASPSLEPSAPLDTAPSLDAAAPAALDEAAPAVTPHTNFALSSDCTVGHAASLKESLAPLLDEPRPVTLDINSLQRIDTAGLQVIVAFIRARAEHGRPVEWQGTAPVLATAAQLLGLTSLLELPA